LGPRGGFIGGADVARNFDLIECSTGGGGAAFDLGRNRLTTPTARSIPDRKDVSA